MAELVRKNIYQCKACESSFSRNTKLQKHMATHTLEENILYGDIFSYHLISIKREVKRLKQKIACPVCPMVYVHRGYYKKHLRTVHGIIEKPVCPSNDILPKVSNGQRGKDVDGRGTVKAPDSSVNRVVKSKKKVHFGPLNPEQGKRGKKRGRPPKGRCLNSESVSDADEGGTMKAADSSRKPVVKSEKKVLFGPHSPEQAKKGRKRGTPSKRRCLRNESGNKKYYECPECKKRMTHFSTLTAHMRIHTGERPYQCLVCSKTFTFYQCLWNHSWRHKTMKSFPCDRCPKIFRYYQCLWTHYKTHTGEKIFKCAICKLEFATAVQLSHHKKKHPEKKEGDPKNSRIICLRTAKVNEMPFKCDICSKKFRLKISLISHQEKCYSKTQLSLKRSRNGHGSSDIFLTSGRAGLDQNQKRSRGRPRKFVKPKVERRVFVSSQTLKDYSRNWHDTCLSCKKVYKNCVCHINCRGKNNEKRNLLELPPFIETDGKKFSQLCHFDHKNMAGGLHGQKSRPKKCYGNMKTAEALLRRSERLKRKEPVASECKTYGQSFTFDSEQNQHTKHHAETKPHSCSHCSKSFKSLPWLLRHQNSAHTGTRKEMSHLKKFKKTRFRKKQRKKSLERKCSCCGTLFISNDDYKKHIACVSCVCGQQFQCAYIFCFHTSTCGEHSVSVEEETVDQKSEDASTSSSSEGNFPHQQDIGQPNSNTVLLCENSKYPQIYANCTSVVSGTTDSASLPSTDLYQSEGWCSQLINTASTSEIGVNWIIHQAKTNGATEAAEDPWDVQEVSEGSELQSELQSDQEAGNQIQIGRKLFGNGQRFQCLICSQGFLSESALAIHSLSHMADCF